MTLRFNPPANIGRYAVFFDFGAGTGSFKTYRDLGSAKIGYHAKANQKFKEARILENVEGEWFTLYLVTPNVTRLPWTREEPRRPGSSYKIWRSVPMTREEYAEWRIKVEHERIASLKAPLYLNNSAGVQ